MSKDIKLLKQISDYFTEETLKSIIAKEKYVDEKCIELVAWTFEDINDKADNYLSMVNKLHLKSKINSIPSETRLIVKSLSKNPFKRKVLRNAEYFYNEITFYTKVATKFNDYLSFKEQTHLLCIPRCLAYHLDGDNDFIVLQDVTTLGYSHITSKNCLTYDECKNVVEALAKFHAISFAYKSDNKHEFDKIALSLNETFYRIDIYEDSFKYIYDHLFRIAKDALAKEYPGSKGEKVFNSYEPVDLYKKTVEVCLRKDPKTSVICQGDSWEPNFMMRKLENNKTDILILDFQIARYASPVLDVIYLIYECTDKSLRDKHYSELLKNYYFELSKTMTILGIDPKKQYPWETFEKEVKEQSIYGLMFALVNIPLTLLPKTDIFDLDSITEQETDLSDLNLFPNLEKAEDRQRLADVILHAVENEFI